MKLFSPSTWRKGLAPALVIVLALLLRLHGLRAGLPALNDPDELMFQLGALKMLRSGTLNPGWFGHPASTTMDALAITDVVVFFTGHLFGAFANVKAFATAIYADPSIVMLPGRLVMVLASLGTVWLTGRFAARQWGREAGLGAAAILAVSPVFVVWSQVIRSDIFACCFMMLALLAAKEIARGAGRRRDLVLCALWTAAAIASKWPFAMVAAAAFGAILLDSARRGLSSSTTTSRLALYSALTLVFLIAISPYLLLDFGTVVRNVAGEAQDRHLGATGGTPLWNAGWYLGGPIARALGLAGCGMAAIGLIQLRRDRDALFLIAPLLLGFSLLLVSQHLVWERWALPLIVLLALPAGVAIARLAQTIAPKNPQVALAVLLVATLAQPAWATVVQGNARNNDTRQRASAWAVAHFRPHATVLVEQFAFDLLPQPWTFYFPLGQAGCVNANDWLHGKVGYSPVEAGRGNRTNVDYGTLAPERESSCRPDFAIISQYDRYLAERSEYPVEVARYERLIGRGRVVATFTPIPGKSAGPVVRIVAFGPAGR